MKLFLKLVLALTIFVVVSTQLVTFHRKTGAVSAVPAEVAGLVSAIALPSKSPFIFTGYGYMADLSYIAEPGGIGRLEPRTDKGTPLTLDLRNLFRTEMYSFPENSYLKRAMSYGWGSFKKLENVENYERWQVSATHSINYLDQRSADSFDCSPLRGSPSRERCAYFGYFVIDKKQPDSSTPPRVIVYQFSAEATNSVVELPLMAKAVEQLISTLIKR